jgi:hypothetical protein
MFGKPLIGYAQHVDAEVQDAANQPTAQGEDQHSWHSWFRKDNARKTADDQAREEPDLDADQSDDESSADTPPLPQTALPQTALPEASPRQDAGSPLDPNDGTVLNDEALLEGGMPVDPGSAAAGGQPDLIDPGRRRALRRPPTTVPLVSRPLINPRLAKDPRLRVWISRTLICASAFIAVTIWKDWRYGVTAAVICAAVDTLFRSRTTGITPTSVRVTAAQHSTARRLRWLRTAGYMTLNTRRLPGSSSVIDHIVVGPSGIYTIDSQLMDKRLNIKAKGGMLYHGPVSQETKLDHATLEAGRAAALISAELGQRVRVRPAMVIHGPSIPWVIMRFKGVDVFDGQHVGAYFKRQSKATAGHHLDSAQVALVFAAAAHALPALK